MFRAVQSYTAIAIAAALHARARATRRTQSRQRARLDFLERLQECRSGFTADMRANIRALTAIGLEEAHADGTVYYHFQAGAFMPLACWPSDFDTGDGAYCLSLLDAGAAEADQEAFVPLSGEAHPLPQQCRSGLGCAVHHEGRLQGALCFFFRDAMPVPGISREHCSLLAREIGVEDRRRRVRELLELQFALGQRLSEEQSLERALQDCLDSAIHIAELDCGGIYLVDEERQEIRLAASSGLSQAFVASARAYPLVSEQGRLLRDGHAVYRPYYELTLPQTPATLAEGLRAIAIIPIFHEGALVSALNVASRHDDDIAAADRVALETIAAQMGSNIARLRRETALRVRELEMRAIFDYIDDFLFVLDERGAILRVNAPVVRRLGYASEELVGQPVALVHPADRREEALGVVADMLAGRRATCPVPLCAKDGTLIPVETRVTRMALGDRELLIGVSHDISERIQAEETLKQSEERYRMLAEAVGQVVWTTDLAGRFTYVSPIISEASNFEGPHNLVGKLFRDFLTPASADLFESTVAGLACTANGTVRSQAATLTLDGYQGDRLPVKLETTFTCLRDADGRPVGLLGATRDRSEWYRLQDEVRWNHALLQAMANSSPLGFCVVDSRIDAVLYANLRFYAIWGLETCSEEIQHGACAGSEIMQRCASQAVDAGNFPVSCQPSETGEAPCIIVDEIPLLDGRTIRRISTQIRDAANRYFGCFYLFEDVTAQKAAESALRYMQQFENLIAALSTRFINCPLPAIDDEIARAMGEIGRFVEADRAYVFRFSDDGLAMSNTHEWCAEGIRPEIENLQQLPVTLLPWWMRAIRALQTLNISRVADLPPEASAERDILEAQDIQSCIVVPMMQEGQACGFLGFDAVAHQRDWSPDTEQLPAMVGDLVGNALARQRAGVQMEALQAALEQRVLELDAANRELEAFTYSVSHDLRAPVVNLRTFSDALLQELGENEATRNAAELTDRIRQSVARMAELIDAFLELSRLSRGPLLLVPVSLTALAQEIAENLARSAPVRTATFSIAPGLETRADPQLLRIALENLLGNAWKYTAPRAETHIEVGQRLDDGEPVFFIRDNGVGFDMAYANRLFVPFQRLHSAREFSGTGIGLTTVQRIIQRHGGRIWAESAVGAGTCFFFTFARQTGPAAAPDDMPVQQEAST